VTMVQYDLFSTCWTIDTSATTTIPIAVLALSEWIDKGRLWNFLHNFIRAFFRKV